METNKDLTSNSGGLWRQWSTASRGLANLHIIAIGLLIVFLGYSARGEVVRRLVTLLPLLLFLVCPVMMFMCMKNMRGNQQNHRDQPPR